MTKKETIKELPVELTLHRVFPVWHRSTFSGHDYVDWEGTVLRPLPINDRFSEDDIEPYE